MECFRLVWKSSLYLNFINSRSFLRVNYYWTSITIDLKHVHCIIQGIEIWSINFIAGVFPNSFSTSGCCTKFWYRQDVLTCIESDWKCISCLTRWDTWICWGRPWTPAIYFCQCRLYYISSCVAISVINEWKNWTRLINRIS